MTPAPPSSSRSDHAQRNVRLDPQGIYGTRSARRQHQLRRRRQFQNALLWAIGALALFGAMRWALQPRQSARAASDLSQLPFHPAAPPLPLGDDALLFASQSGGLWRVSLASSHSATGAPDEAPKRLFSTAFPPAAPLLMTSQQVFWPGADGTLIALEPGALEPGALNGAAARVPWRVRWRASLPSALVARPALVGVGKRQLVVAGDDEGNVAAFDARSGTLAWRTALGGALGNGIGVLATKNRDSVSAAPTIAAPNPNNQQPNTPANAVTNDAITNDDASARPIAATEKPGDGTAANGTAANGTAANGAAARPVAPAGTASDSPAIVVPLLSGGATRGGLICLDARTGARRWSFPDDARSQSAGAATPALWNGRVFWCNDEGAVVCLDGATGRKVWKNFAAPETPASAAPDDELVMLRGAPVVVASQSAVVVGGNDGILRAFDLASGTLLWKQSLGGSLPFAVQKLSFEGKSALLATGEMPAIFLIDAHSGAVMRRWTTPQINSYSAALTPENIYASDAEGRLQVAPLQ